METLGGYKERAFARMVAIDQCQGGVQIVLSVAAGNGTAFGRTKKLKAGLRTCPVAAGAARQKQRLNGICESFGGARREVVDRTVR